LDIDTTNASAPPEPASWRSFWIVFPVLAAALLGAAWLVLDWRVQQSVAGITQSERAVVERYVDLMSRQLRQAAVDVCAFARQNELHDYLESGNSNALALGAMEFANRVRLSGNYDHIRFIDPAGNELVRVNSVEGVPVVVADDDLQPKAGRYYIDELNDLERNEVYISPVDLNIERGEIELPHKPVMRFGTSVYGDDGNLEGFVVINVLARPMLDAVIKQSRFNDGNPMLINEEGYWLVDPTMPASWGFLYPQFKDERMPVVYPQEWALFHENEEGSINTDNGLFTFAHYVPVSDVGYCEPTRNTPAAEEPDEDDFRWILASHVPTSALREARWQIGRQMILPVVLGLGLLVVGTRMGTKEYARRRYRHRLLEHRAGIDTLTGLANRAAFEDQLAQEAARADRQRSKFAVILADLDGFKAVNDSRGHKAGDRVLREVARAFRDSGRSTDTAARLGGDEFVVLLSGIADERGAKRVAESILERIGEIREGGHAIGASMGIGIYPDNATDAGEVIVLADRAMYRAKQRGRNLVRTAADLTASPADPQG